VFTRGDLASIEVIKRALHMFRICSGLEPSIAKIEVFFFNVPMAAREAILNSLPFQLGMFPIRYLGVPLSLLRLKVRDYAPLVSKVKMRIHDWKSIFLSFGGRKQFIISVLQSMQLYWMLVFILPSTIIHDLETLFRDFLWAQGDDSRGKCRIAWDAVCKTIDNDGFGFKRFATWKRVLVTKHIWDVLSRRNNLWVNWIWLHCIQDGSFWSISTRPSWSWIFRKMLTLRP